MLDKKYKVVIVIVFSFFANGCLSSSKNEAVLSNWTSLEQSDWRWYEKHLVAMNEPNLFKLDAQQSIRFTWLRSFHEPISVRVDCTKECTLTAKVMSGKGGYEPGHLKNSVSRTLSENEKISLQTALSDMNFWDGAPDIEHWGLDGARWILEGKRDDTYAVWDVWSPSGISQYLKFRDFCISLLDFADIHIDPELVY